MSTVNGASGAGLRRWRDRLAGSALGIDRVGKGCVFSGRPHIANDGRIEIGAACRISSHPVTSHLVTQPGARIVIGDRVQISYGAAVSSAREISIGDDTSIGPWCLILDNDFHQVGNRDLPGIAAPVVIGRGVRIGARVTLLRGARVGDGARVHSGSTISGVVPAGAEVSGVPARVAARSPVPRPDPAVATIVMRILGRAAMAAPSGVPGALRFADGAAATRLTLALEESFGITLDADAVAAMQSIADLSGAVAQARAVPAPAT
jgi:acetyltransferase-like isoleucine patch superfamily enzyme